jgi:hypothetical protein
MYVTVFLPRECDMSQQLRVRMSGHAAVGAAKGRLEPTLKMFLRLKINGSVDMKTDLLRTHVLSVAQSVKHTGQLKYCAIQASVSHI